MLSIRNLIRTFAQAEGSLRVLDQLDFDMDAGSSVALLGESGSGKSTLLHLIAGLDKPDAGTVSGIDKKKVGFIYQEYMLFPHLDVFQNIAPFVKKIIVEMLNQRLIIFLLIQRKKKF